MDNGNENIMETLASEGGAPVRTRPVPPRGLGANLIGKEELELLKEIVEKRTPFRHYGPSEPHLARDFERAVCDFVGTRYTLATATGSGGFFCAMKALDIGPGDEVILPALGFVTDYDMVAVFGAKPVFAKIDGSMNLDPDDMAAKITDSTKAAVVIHYQGGASRVDDVVARAHERGVKVLEDVAQAFGATFDGRPLGGWGDIACGSLQANKMITAGEGGFVMTNDQLLFERAVRFHDLGLLRTAFKEQLEAPVKTKAFPGMQWRMTELAVAFALAQIRRLPGMVARTQRNAAFLRERIHAAFPAVEFRGVKPENDAGILVQLDMGSPENAQFFAEAHTAEGFRCGVASGTGPMDKFEVVRNDMAPFDEPTRAAFAHAAAIHKRRPCISILPVYDDADMEDLAAISLKVLTVMRSRSMIE
jgi:8-amino-3,8-dideoxy-alpha-D-manno-octulosonate transaminase